jgi:uncharacterized membrane protein YgaE (UPF0421/DUF939 family)
MCEILNNRSFYESSAFGAIIGFVGSFLIFIISDALRNHQDKLKNKKKYHSWINGAKAEINHLLKVIAELKTTLNRGVPTTKRLNEDYIKSLRFKLLEFENDITFLEVITNAFRDIEHTNGMLDRLEENFKPGDKSINNVIGCLDGVKTSVEKLKDILNKK